LLVLVSLAGLAANLIVNLLVLVLEGLSAQGLRGGWERGDLFLVKVLPIVALCDPRFVRGAACLSGGVGGLGGGEIDLAGEVQHPHSEVRLAAGAGVAAEALGAAAPLYFVFPMYASAGATCESKSKELQPGLRVDGTAFHGMDANGRGHVESN
jgi:hypothetical protein